MNQTNEALKAELATEVRKCQAASEIDRGRVGMRLRTLDYDASTELHQFYSIAAYAHEAKDVRLCKRFLKKQF